MTSDEEFKCCITTCGLPLNENYWDKQYQNNETGWDLKSVSPPLKEFIDTLTDKNLKILIPGCGNAYEAEYLLDKGFNNVTLIDISSTLVNNLKKKFEGKPIRILHNDFFDHHETYDLIIEQTFFCAINPALRIRYAAKCFRLLNDNGRIAGVLFNIIFEKEGPPYGGHKDEYMLLLEPLFNIKQFDVCKNSIPPRSGNELFIELKRKNILSDFVNLYSISGITCSGCKETIINVLNKLNNVKSVSINTDFSELLILSDEKLNKTSLENALSKDKKYQLKEIKN